MSFTRYRYLTAVNSRLTTSVELKHPGSSFWMVLRRASPVFIQPLKLSPRAPRLDAAYDGNSILKINTRNAALYTP
ncbi:hypothetical protein BDZ89DRAFT_1066620 [Hymenopellis radicata]|nr:hypothetical protein BDZ89DRAFT_1066620 [Hymenopellis radicata]